MKIFNFGIATEANDDFIANTEDEVWIRDENGKLTLMEDDEDESDSEGQ